MASWICTRHWIDRVQGDIRKIFFLSDLCQVGHVLLSMRLWLLSQIMFLLVLRLFLVPLAIFIKQEKLSQLLSFKILLSGKMRSFTKLRVYGSQKRGSRCMKAKGVPLNHRLHVHNSRVKISKKKRFAGPYDIALVRSRSQIVFVPGRIMPVGKSMTKILSAQIAFCGEHEAIIWNDFCRIPIISKNDVWQKVSTLPDLLGQGARPTKDQKDLKGLCCWSLS